MDGSKAWVILTAVAVGALPGPLLLFGMDRWLNRRAQRRWAAEDRRQALQQQLRVMEVAVGAVGEEQWSDEEREWPHLYREREFAIKRGAQRRFSLLEEDDRFSKTYRREATMRSHERCYDLAFFLLAFRCWWSCVWPSRAISSIAVPALHPGRWRRL